MIPRAHQVLPWLGTATGIGGALWVAAHVPSSGCGYYLFSLSSLSWCWVARARHDRALWSLNLVWLAINVFGLVRWFG